MPIPRGKITTRQYNSSCRERTANTVHHRRLRATCQVLMACFSYQLVGMHAFAPMAYPYGSLTPPWLTLLGGLAPPWHAFTSMPLPFHAFTLPCLHPSIPLSCHAFTALQHDFAPLIRCLISLWYAFRPLLRTVATDGLYLPSHLQHAFTLIACLSPATVYLLCR